MTAKRASSAATVAAREPLDADLRFAIANKRLLGVLYHARLRVVEPHDYGVKKGAAKLLVYQLGVEGSAGAKPARGWRLLDVGAIEACRVLEQTFAGSRGASHQRHLQWDRLFARVE